MLTTVLKLLEMFEIDLMDFRGQSYDNASNMSGKYLGLQARINEINSKASYIPCAAHSLNLVGLNASSSCFHIFSSCKKYITFFRITPQVGTVKNFFCG